MSTELLPAQSAELALQVYDVNSGNADALKLFLKNKLFASTQKKPNSKSAAPAKGAAQKMLTGHVGGRIFRAAKDGFGLCAQGGGDHKNDLFLVFRGTTAANNKADMVTDARIGITLSKAGLPVHVGFNHTFNSMLPDIREFIRDANVTGTVHCVGHSLGGAVASLAADWVARNTSLTAKLYTFGAPRVGTSIFARSTTRAIVEFNMHRVYHKTDPVPMVALYPFMQAPYSKEGHYIYSSDPLTAGSAHFMAKYERSVSGKSWLQLCDLPEHRYDIESAIEDWLKSKSPVDANSAAFWRWLDAAMIYVLKKVAITAIMALQGAFIGVMTLADKIAYILAKGIELADDISIWVEYLMRKIMQALGMKVAATKKELTRSLIRQALMRITEKATREARNAIRKI